MVSRYKITLLKQQGSVTVELQELIAARSKNFRLLLEKAGSEEWPVDQLAALMHEDRQQGKPPEQRDTDSTATLAELQGSLDGKELLSLDTCNQLAGLFGIDAAQLYVEPLNGEARRLQNPTESSDPDTQSHDQPPTTPESFDTTDDATEMRDTDASEDTSSSGTDATIHSSDAKATTRKTKKRRRAVKKGSTRRKIVPTRAVPVPNDSIDVRTTAKQMRLLMGDLDGIIRIRKEGGTLVLATTITLEKRMTQSAFWETLLNR